MVDDLLYYDGVPYTFTAIADDEKFYLFHWADTTKILDKYLVVPITEKEVNQLKNKEITLFDVLHVEEVAVVDFIYEIDQIYTRPTSLKEIPEDFFPHQGETL